MNEKKKILNNYKKKLNILKKHNKYYFLDDNIFVSQLGSISGTEERRSLV